MSPDDFYAASNQAMQGYDVMRAARLAEVQRFQFDGTDTDKATALRWKVAQGWEFTLLRQANEFCGMAVYEHLKAVGF